MSGTYSELATSLQDGTLPPECFGHREHLGVAHYLLTTCEFLDAIMLYSKGIRNMAERAGLADKFNLTTTIAFLSIMSERLSSNPKISFEAFLETNPDLMSRELLNKYYPPERLNSRLARRIFLMPQTNLDQKVMSGTR